MRKQYMIELSEVISEAEKVERDPVNSDHEWKLFTEALKKAKGVMQSATDADMTDAIEQLRLAIKTVIIKEVPGYLGDFKMIPYNNPGLRVPIQTGLHAHIGFWDIDGDGDMDFISDGFSTSYSGRGTGLFAFRNLKNEKGTTFFGNAEYIQHNVRKPWWSMKKDGSPVFVTEPGDMYTELTNAGLGEPRHYEKLNFQFKLYDVDGDGVSDAVFVDNVRVGEEKYNSEGIWQATSTSSIKWIKNTGTEYEPDFSSEIRSFKAKDGNDFIIDNGSAFDRYFHSFSLVDLDGDGDLDLIAGGKLDSFWYYENIGDAKTPVFKTEGVKIETVSGPLRLDVCWYQLINYDWDGDGYDDIFLGSESGTTLYLRFTGKFNEKTGAPIFEDGQYLTKEAEYLAVNALSRPTACDFDGDGDVDFIVGDNGGFLWFYENLTGGAAPSWAAPVKLTDENGVPLEIKAGYNGSLQGSGEAAWGYSIPCACDWDGDGDVDIIVNSVTGRIVWFENIGTATKPQLTQPKPIEVEWENENLYPWWYWWKPEGKELVAQHRTTPFAIDLNGDGLCDLVMLDHEGYLAFFERYKENGELKLRQGKRIFFDMNGVPLRLNEGIHGRCGRVKLAMADWNGDGIFDLLTVKYANKQSPNVELYLTRKIEDGKYYLEEQGNLGEGDFHGHHQGFTIVDWNGDGKPDVVSGSESGYFYYFENNTK